MERHQSVAGPALGVDGPPGVVGVAGVLGRPGVLGVDGRAVLPGEPNAPGVIPVILCPPTGETGPGGGPP